MASAATAKWYRDYLETPHWAEIRQLKIDTAGPRCERCGELPRRGLNGAELGLHVHHRNYDRVGQELLTDLEVLCEACHKIEHGIIPDTEAARAEIRRSHSHRITARSTGYTGEEIDDEIAQWDRLADEVGM